MVSVTLNTVKSAMTENWQFTGIASLFPWSSVDVAFHLSASPVNTSRWSVWGAAAPAHLVCR
jgi:hypothetical protein